MEEIILIAHLFDSCRPVFPVETWQYCISQAILKHHLNDIKCLLASEHDSEGGFVLAHLFLWRIYPEINSIRKNRLILEEQPWYM